MGVPFIFYCSAVVKVSDHATGIRQLKTLLILGFIKKSRRHSKSVKANPCFCDKKKKSFTFFFSLFVGRRIRNLESNGIPTAIEEFASGE